MPYHSGGAFKPFDLGKVLATAETIKGARQQGILNQMKIAGAGQEAEIAASKEARDVQTFEMKQKMNAVVFEAAQSEKDYKKQKRFFENQGRLFGLVQSANDISGIIAIAEQKGMDTKPLQMLLEQIKELPPKKQQEVIANVRKGWRTAEEQLKFTKQQVDEKRYEAKLAEEARKEQEKQAKETRKAEDNAKKAANEVKAAAKKETQNEVKSLQKKLDRVNKALSTDKGLEGSARSQNITSMESRFLRSDVEVFDSEKAETALREQQKELQAKIAKLKAELKQGGENVIPGLPEGAKIIGTSGGKPVYQTPDGKQFVAE